MLRCSHKKSRGGCLECKRRHVKCDEGRPMCALCIVSKRVCSYSIQAPLENQSTSGLSSHEQSTSPGDSHGRGVVTVPGHTPLTSTSFANFQDERQGLKTNHNAVLANAVNFEHMELLVHLMLDKEVFSLGTDISPGAHPSNIIIALKVGLESSYLLHQLLAFSARHLAFLHPESPNSYLRQADTLQTCAISLFNAAWTAVDRSNCMAILLFSSVLGHHLLADTLAKRDLGGLASFMTRYSQCLDMQRGIYTIAKTAWPLLMDTELEPILSSSSAFTSRSPRGNHCQRLRDLVEGSNRLREEDKEACRLAIQYLQVGFDAALAQEEEEEQSNRHQMVFSWSMLVPPEFTGLLATNQPEALVLLAYYALLLHYARNMWQIRDAGIYILGTIVDHLDPGWDHWLEYPQRQIAKDLGADL